MILPVKTASGGYDIALARGALSHLGDYLPHAGRALIVTDDGVPAEYAHAAAAVCENSAIVTLPQGEATKNLDSHRMLLARMLELGFTRADRVIAVGGGVMGDLAGFAAAVYMRGIDFYNLPTTLLSQVDSSIGGKVAVDMQGVKNVVGAFYPPKKVIIDPDALNTLPSRQIAAGLAESIKMAATSNAGLFALIEQSDNLNRDLDAILEGSLKSSATWSSRTRPKRACARCSISATRSATRSKAQWTAAGCTANASPRACCRCARPPRASAWNACCKNTVSRRMRTYRRTGSSPICSTTKRRSTAA